MKDCEKCIHINFTKEDYKIASEKPFVIERVAEKQVKPMIEVPLCILYGKICEGYKPCEKCKENKYKEYKERL